MKHIIVRKTGGPDRLRIEECPDPLPKSKEVLIRVRAIGINFADVLIRQGLYQDVPRYPIVPGYEVSGVVEGVGEGVDPSWIGREIFALTLFGGYAEKICLPLTHVFEKPKRLSFEVASGLPTTYATAWQLLVVMGGLKKGERVLIHNAGGGVGLAALDIARWIGAETYGTASRGKHERLLSLGLTHAIDYIRGDWEEEFRDLTQNQGAHLIVDPLGGKSFKKSFRSLAPTGRLGMFGISEASHTGIRGKIELLKTALFMPFFHPITLMNQNRAVFGVNLARFAEEPSILKEWLKNVLDLVDEGNLNPTIDRSFSFDDVQDAHRHIEARKNFGKVVLTLPE